MRLLLTNDDGIDSEGLHALARHFEIDNEVIIAAPMEQRSASSHSITMSKVIDVKERKIEGIKSKAYSINGTPADCVRIALDKLVDKVDMVISGVNRGYNVGIDVVYSGTVSAAIEAAICKVPSIAVSMQAENKGFDFNVAVECAKKVFETAKSKYMKDDVVLNLNVPDVKSEELKGIKVCKTGFKMYHGFYVEKSDENNNIGFYQEAKPTGYDVEGTDLYYVKRGYATLTPLHYDLTNYKILDEVEKIFK
ncbi:5'/3'-nucleotidase SurE [Clostridium sp. cel8]|jgi:5'-nucleotidase|uniref:5'/3'-nucleotidase SurE n=1 Tax=Clostridium sp. cel8 TaxID=2663123 RepID=UPI0015F4E005|nr:5'/3'-nucleotidase SurE [Clostridium sp. cel8]MBA5850058.1 5'/3'-nucleotidase SurE [Clostridium sp. cel8]